MRQSKTRVGGAAGVLPRGLAPAGGAAASTSRSVAEIVRDARVERGWSQRRLADAIGTTNTAVSRLESGRHTPSVAMLTRLARVLGVTFTIGPHSATPQDGVDRREIKRVLRMSDREREAWYLDSNRNMLRMFQSARREE